MADLITAPGQTTTLSNVGTYASATITANSNLLVQGDGAVITVLGTTTEQSNAGITVDDGGDLRLLGQFSGAVNLTGNKSVVELGAGPGSVNLLAGAPYTPRETNGTIVVDEAGAQVAVLGFYAGDTLAFASPATSFIYTADQSGSLGIQVIGTLSVTEATGAIANFTLEGTFSDSYTFLPSYAQGNFAIANGNIIYQAIVPPASPTISGARAGQQVYQGEMIQAFASVVITDPNANQTETVKIVPSQVTGVLSDPNAAADGSSYDAATGTYNVNGTASAVSQSIDSLIFTPNVYTLGTAGTLTTQFQISVTDTVGAMAADNTTSVVAVACFAAGTMIHTDQGPTPVQALRVGMLVKASHGYRPIIWLGRRKVCCNTHPNPLEIWPVEIAPHAFADGVPSLRVRLSPDHAVFQDGMLIPVKHLINGSSIAQIRVDEVEYWHVELDRHDVLLASGLPCESYLDTGNRTAFSNSGTEIQMHPEFSPRTWDDACAELVQDGDRLIAAKRSLFERMQITDDRPRPSLSVLSDEKPVSPESSLNDFRVYRLHSGARSCRLKSASWVPAHCIAASLDRRRLGVRLFEVQIDGKELDLRDPAFFSGFHAVEETAEGVCRWTDGDARIVLPSGAVSVALRIEPSADRLVRAVQFAA